MTNKRPQPGHEIGIIGLGVIGRNLLLNMADHGFPVAAGVTSSKTRRIITMQTVTKKSVVESPPSKPTTAKEPDIASVPVPDTLAALHVNPETGLTHAEVDTRHAAIRAVADAGFAMAVTAVIGRLLGLVAEG
jgi:3-hydroxyisobutyrate dehydrogenase-like beta-hydroxyacid dehydrogenase